MAVFHVTDLNGNKLADKSVIRKMEESLGTIHEMRLLGVEGLTALELLGNDRVGLLSEMFAVLSELMCHVIEAKVWTHHGRIALIIHVSDCNFQIMDSQRISAILARLRPILKGDDDISTIKTNVSIAITHMERRLHQMMFADRVFKMACISSVESDSSVVTIQNLKRWDYSLVNIKCKDRMKLSFDVVFTLIDLGYVVFHANSITKGDHTHLEFYIKNKKDGTAISSDAEEKHLIQCLQAAIERRMYLGIRLELSNKYHQWLLADVTRTFRENGLNVTMAEISTSGNLSLQTFHVTNSDGCLPDQKTIDNVREKIGSSHLQVKEQLSLTYEHKALEGKNEEGFSIFRSIFISLGIIVSKNLYNSSLIKSDSSNTCGGKWIPRGANLFF